MAVAFSSSQKSYDVFLSFRGEDTRNNFTAHLYKELRTKGINAFFDEDKLERGRVISPALITAIENSMFSIIVMSENYASSRWCLEELVKILECNKSKEERVLPIFYNVDPSDVRNQRGNFGEALAKHEEKLEENRERVKVWREALTQVANLSGWDSRNKNEPLLIKEIVKNLLKKLLITSTSDTEENLVGMHSRIQELRMLLCLQSDDVRMVGICGMGGIGKTTLARAIYRQISYQFEACSFLEIADDFKERDLTNLVEKLLSQLLEEENLKVKGFTSIKARLHSRKVLVVLDNVNNKTTLEQLVGNQDWFGQGSRIIVTTRDKRVLISHRINYYEVSEFNDGEAFEFLKHYSLKHELLENDSLELSREVIHYARGLPLALRVLGSFLFSMNKGEWRDYLVKLKSIPNMKIQEVLKLSYDRLDDNEKNIFLDIACFFKGGHKDYVMKILDGCGFFAHCGIRTLMDKSLITIYANKLEMHDLIQEKGKEIVRQQSPTDPGKRSRLWLHDDIFNVLKRNTGKEKIEGIFLNLSHVEDILDFTTQAFVGMNKLRLLKVYKRNGISRDVGDTFNNKENCKVQFSHGFKFCSNDLRYLYWHGYSLKSLPNDFNPKHLVELSMPCSHIKLLWKGIKVLEKLKSMDLSHSKYLIQTPDFSRITNLERLVLKGCINLGKFHPSLGNLSKLKFLSLKNCKLLRSLPSSICNLKSLETFILSGCSKFKEFPENFGNLEMLKELHADGIIVRVLPPSLFSMRNLKILSFRGCKGPPSASWLWQKKSSNSICFMVPSSSNFCSLRKLNLSECNISDGANLSSLGLLSSLEWLNLSGNNFVTLPNISRLSHLQSLVLENCKRLQRITQLPSSLLNFYCNKSDAANLSSLDILSSLVWLNLSGNNLVILPNISRLSHLKWLVLENCKRLQTLTLLPSSIRRLAATNCTSLETVELLNSLLITVDPPAQEEFQDATYAVLIPGSRIPDWIRYQSWKGEIEVELPPNWSTNVLGFSFALVIVCESRIHEYRFLSPHICLLLFTSNHTASYSVAVRPIVVRHEEMESDHVVLAYAPIPFSVDRHRVTRIKAIFLPNWLGISEHEIRRCGFSLMYVNQEVNYDNLQKIQFNSLFCTPPNNSTLVLKEIYAGEPIECESFDHDSESESASESKSESENPDYATEDQGEPGESESELQGTISLDEGEPSGSRRPVYNDFHSCHASESEETKHLQITPNLPRNPTLASGLAFLLGMGMLASFWLKGRAFLTKRERKKT